MTKKMTILCLMTVVFIGCAPRGQEHVLLMSAQSAIATDNVIRLSRQACAGKVDVPVDAQAIVTETNGNFVVKFPQPFQPGLLHGEYYAQVTIEKASGKIMQILASD